MTYTERQAEITRIREENKAILSTPLMSEGGISPAELGMLSERQLDKYRRNSQERMRLESRIRELSQSDAEIAKIEQFYADKARSGRIAQLTRRISDLQAVRVGKSGKMRPTYQREIDKAKAELATLQ